MDTQEYIAYQRSIKSYRDIKSGEISSYELGMEKGEKLGLEKGEKLGLEKGEKLGLEKGEKLGLEKGIKSIIRNMHKNGVGTDAISAMTGIELAKIESILSR